MRKQDENKTQTCIPLSFEEVSANFSETFVSQNTMTFYLGDLR